MSDEHFEITEKEFEDRFPLLHNHINPTAGWTTRPDGRGCLFETYGDELDFVRRFDPRRVWTVIDGENGNLCIASGMHLVNRIGYLLSQYPAPPDTSYSVSVSFQKEDGQ